MCVERCCQEWDLPEWSHPVNRTSGFGRESSSAHLNFETFGFLLTQSHMCSCVFDICVSSKGGETLLRGLKFKSYSPLCHSLNSLTQTAKERVDDSGGTCKSALNKTSFFDQSSRHCWRGSGDGLPVMFHQSWHRHFMKTKLWKTNRDSLVQTPHLSLSDLTLTSIYCEKYWIGLRFLKMVLFPVRRPG